MDYFVEVVRPEEINEPPRKWRNSWKWRSWAAHDSRGNVIAIGDCTSGLLDPLHQVLLLACPVRPDAESDSEQGDAGEEQPEGEAKAEQRGDITIIAPRGSRLIRAHCSLLSRNCFRHLAFHCFCPLFFRP